MRLAVELGGVCLGLLEGDSVRTADFSLSEEGSAVGKENPNALSVSIPLVPNQLRRDKAAVRRNWFAELLPEGRQLTYMLAQAGLPRDDYLRFLARYGRDVAGALQVWDIDDPTEPVPSGQQMLTGGNIRELLETPTQSPLGNQKVLGKTSLAGVQSKIALLWEDSQWHQAFGGTATTHILKPQNPDNPAAIFDEEYGMRVAGLLALSQHSTEIQNFDGLSALVIERFDRVHGVRIHQEDFNQVLGASGNEKYQEIGGRVSMRRIAEVVSRFGESGDVNRLARMLILSVAIGNLDMHAKNLSLLHARDGRVMLAPAYDVVPQAHVPGIDGRMAMSIDGEYRHAALTKNHLTSEISSWKVRRPQQLVEDTLEEVKAILQKEEPLPQAAKYLHESRLVAVLNLLGGKYVSEGA